MGLLWGFSSIYMCNCQLPRWVRVFLLSLVWAGVCLVLFVYLLVMGRLGGAGSYLLDCVADLLVHYTCVLNFLFIIGYFSDGRVSIGGCVWCF